MMDDRESKRSPRAKSPKVEIILEARVNPNDEIELYVKWKDCGYDQGTWIEANSVKPKGIVDEFFKSLKNKSKLESKLDVRSSQVLDALKRSKKTEKLRAKVQKKMKENIKMKEKLVENTEESSFLLSDEEQSMQPPIELKNLKIVISPIDKAMMENAGTSTPIKTDSTIKTKRALSLKKPRKLGVYDLTHESDKEVSTSTEFNKSNSLRNSSKSKTKKSKRAADPPYPNSKSNGKTSRKSARKLTEIENRAEEASMDSVDRMDGIEDSIIAKNDDYPMNDNMNTVEKQTTISYDKTQLMETLELEENIFNPIDKLDNVELIQNENFAENPTPIPIQNAEFDSSTVETDINLAEAESNNNEIETVQVEKIDVIEAQETIVKVEPNDETMTGIEAGKKATKALKKHPKASKLLKKSVAQNALRRSSQRAKKLPVPLKIIGVTRQFDENIFIIAFDDPQTRPQTMKASVAKNLIPHLVIEFYEQHFQWLE